MLHTEVLTFRVSWRYTKVWPFRESYLAVLSDVSIFIKLWIQNGKEYWFLISLSFSLRRALAMFNYEERSKRENKILSDFREMIHQKINNKKWTVNHNFPFAHLLHVISYPALLLLLLLLFFFLIQVWQQTAKIVQRTGFLATTRATATKTSLKKWIRATSNFIAHVRTCLICQMLVNFSGVEF